MIKRIRVKINNFQSKVIAKKTNDTLKLLNDLHSLKEVVKGMEKDSNDHAKTLHQITLLEYKLIRIEKQIGIKNMKYIRETIQ